MVCWLVFSALILPAGPAQGETITVSSSATLSGYCFVDENGNGMRDDSEHPLPDASVTLTELILFFFPVQGDSAAPDGDGHYEFSGLSAGLYVLECTAPGMGEVTTPNPALAVATFFAGADSINFGFSPSGQDIPAVTDFIAAGSDQKTGLAWKNPSGTGWQRIVITRSPTAYPASPDDGTVVYSGTGTDTVDGGLEPGAPCYYSAFVCTDDDACFEPSATAAATPRDISGADWSDWQTQPDPFADEVVSFEPAVSDEDPFGYDKLPDVVLGPPAGAGNGQGGTDVLSLGANSLDNATQSTPCGGSITLKFTDNIIVNGEGPDFTVFENPFFFNADDTAAAFMEPAVVWVSRDGITFYRIPFDYVPIETEDPSQMEIIEHCRNPATYASGFAGVRPVVSNDLFPDPADPGVSGGDSFDIDAVEEAQLGWIQYIRIQSTGDKWLTDADGDVVRHNPETGACSGTYMSGFDLDGVCAVHY